MRDEALQGYPSTKPGIAVSASSLTCVRYEADDTGTPVGRMIPHVGLRKSSDDLIASLLDWPTDRSACMAKQAEAERERRSKVIAAEGEYQASQRLADAAKVLADQPSALTLRYLQTLREIATENNSTTIFPVPIDLLKPFLKQSDRSEQV